MERKTYKTTLVGRELIFEFGRFAEQANGSVLVTYGGTAVLATAVASLEPIDRDFMPLMVNYEERLYAGGIIKGSRFIKREGRPTDESILAQRVIDRSIRPLFNGSMRNNTQVIITIIAFDGENNPDMVAGLAASAALAVSDIPWEGPIAVGRVCLVEDKLTLMPTVAEQNESRLDLIVATTAQNVVMIEAGADEIPETEMLAAIEFGKKELVKVAKFIAQIVKEIGRTKFTIEEYEAPQDLVTEIEKNYQGKVIEMLAISNKSERERTMKLFFKEVKEAYAECEDLDEQARASIAGVLNKLIKKTIRTDILENRKRMGGRAMDEVRPLSVEVGVFERLHGSALFQRGDTQGLTIVTVGSPGDAQILESLYGESKKRYMHHYNFPPFSVGEADGRLFANNRAIGHGALAERALTPMLPKVEDFPYTLRLVTEILSSNGSSSMAAVCGSTLALMDAGVPIRKPVAGIAMGMVANEDLSKFEILTDLQGEEDFTGDMDFKVAGTKDGITAIQMDIKVKGLTPAIFEQALQQAQAGRLFILDKMLSVISESRADMSKYAPHILTMRIKPDQIGAVIGKGGEIINKIIEETGVQIDIEEDGLVFITGEVEGAKKAQAWIENIVYKPQIGDEFEGKVIKILDFGAFVEYLPGKEGLVHISQLAQHRVNRVEDVVKEGDKLKVRVIEVDDRGRTNLSHKVCLPSSNRGFDNKRPSHLSREAHLGRHRNSDNGQPPKFESRKDKEDSRSPLDKKPHETDPERSEPKLPEMEF